MGIEAHCPNGHRVKVKRELAGRLGICPTCGERFRVPDPAAVMPAHVGGESAVAPALPPAKLLHLDRAVVANLPAARPFGRGVVVPLPTPTPLPLPVGPVGTPFEGTDPAFLQTQPPSRMQPGAGWPDEFPASGPPRGPRRTRRGGDGSGLAVSLLLLVAVVAAAAVAWLILRKQGILP